MSITRTIGGDRLGAGKKQKVTMQAYERSTHDLGYIWRSTIAAGTLVPFMTELGLPGDTFDIDLDADIKTHPTVGPLFGSFKVQLDVFICPIRLYQGQLHNNKLGIGMKMSEVLLPGMNMDAEWRIAIGDLDNMQINPSSIFSYLNIRGLGRTPDNAAGTVRRQFNAIPYIAYHDIFKNYYANKQEENALFIDTAIPEVVETVTTIDAVSGVSGGTVVPMLPTMGLLKLNRSAYLKMNFTGGIPDPETVYLRTNVGELPVTEIFENVDIVGVTHYDLKIVKINTSDLQVYGWRYTDGGDLTDREPQLTAFPLENIDQMREDILQYTTTDGRFIIDDTTIAPYGTNLGRKNGFYAKQSSQQGLLVKTYQSDLFNNWMKTEWIDGDNGVNALSAVDTSGGSFTMDTLNLAQKVYEMMNRIAMSGGSYDDWLDVTYTHERYRRASTPMYMGGLSKELVFQEVVSNSDSADQPLGTLAGKGVMAGKHKGGSITVKVEEPSYIMGIISLTPRVDYSQGNKWDVNLKTMDDFHKPALDQIGFQDLITDQMAWWDTVMTSNNNPTFKSAGKQPAWLNYMTNVNQVRGNFAIKGNEMFMTLNRMYENANLNGISDLTTYVDPVKFNHIFAQTSRDAMNFWSQIKVDIKARRKMSAKMMPNL